MFERTVRSFSSMLDIGKLILTTRRLTRRISFSSMLDIGKLIHLL